jgi:pimeloyl-ACP methyl ester carboxylesterase
MKRFSFIIALNILSIGLFAQVKNDSLYSESEVILKTSTGEIYGTLAIPNNVKTSLVILIIAGSGPTDRDGNSPMMGLQTNAYKMLSESLAKNGISSVRFDKRGIGESKQAITSESDLRFDTYINDVVLWIELLKSDRRFSKIYILGHSEGSLIGMIAAEQTNTSGFISIAGAGKSADKILQEQLKTKLPPLLLDESNKILDSLKIGKTVSNVNPSLVSLYRPSVQPYMISWIKYDPAKEIGKLKIPVLIIQGTTDLQVTVDDSKLLSAANTNAKLLIIENMNHTLKESDSDIQKNMATYNNPDLPLKEGLTDDIVNFINSTK